MKMNNNINEHAIRAFKVPGRLRQASVSACALCCLSSTTTDLSKVKEWLDGLSLEGLDKDAIYTELTGTVEHLKIRPDHMSHHLKSIAAIRNEEGAESIRDVCIAVCQCIGINPSESGELLKVATQLGIDSAAIKQRIAEY